jgi:glycosyltransferase involved in cell wall biosynthesis
MTERLPIAFVLNSFQPGGTEGQMIELVRRLDPKRWRVHIACLHASGDWLDRALEATTSVTEFPVRSFLHSSAPVQMRAFARWCRANRIVVVHTADLYANIFGLPAAALARVPVRIGNRREINPDKTLGQIVAQRLAYTFAHKVVANSQAAADRLFVEAVPESKVAVVPNGLDVQKFHSRSPRRSLRKVIMVANLRQEKGHDVLMAAALSVLQRYPDATFEIVGDGPEHDRLLARHKALGLTTSFSFLGHRDDVPRRLAEADLFVLPSRSEAFPSAVLEAMAAGLPVVASAVGGILELVDDERTGLLAPADDAGALADRLCRLMTDPELGARLGEAARERVSARYSFDRMIASFEFLYLTQLTRRGLAFAPEVQLASF